VPPRASAFPIDLPALGALHLAQFVGTFANRHILADMKRAGFGDLRESHGYLIQHLLKGPHSVGQLSRLLGISQQAVSKTVAELTRSGYLETQAGEEDARVRLVQLTERGHASVLAARRFRERLERRLQTRLGPKRSAALRASLVAVLQELGGTDSVLSRRVPSPEGE